MGGLRRFLQAIPTPTVPGKFVLPFLLIGFWFPLSIGNNALFFASSCVVATVLASVLWTALAAPPLRIERKLARRVFAGESFPVRVRIENPSRFRPALGVAFRDALQKTAAPGEVTCGETVPILPPGGVAEIDYEARIHRRGVHRITNFLVATRFPFGLFERRFMVGDPCIVTVLPGIGSIQKEARAALARGSREESAREARRPGHDEFHALRPFLPGDNPRHIHWRTSARAGTLMRREFRAEAGAGWTIFLDSAPPPVMRDEGRRVFEKAVSCAATLLVEAAREGRRVRLHVAGRPPVEIVGRRGLFPALETLAEVQVSDEPAESLVARAPVARGGGALLLSLHGDAEKARRAAARRSLSLAVWDASSPAFDRIFRRA